MVRPLALGLIFALSACSAPPTQPPQNLPTATATATTAVPTAPSVSGPPLARREAISETLHGVEVSDPYRWLEDEKAEEVQAFLREHQAHTRKELDAMAWRTPLVNRLTELSYLESVSPPSRKGKRFFFSRRHKDKEKTVYYWREGREGKDHVLVDPNTLSEDGSVSVRGVSISWDGKWAAYKKAENNADEANLEIMEVATGKVRQAEIIAGAKYASASWDATSKGFYYTRIPLAGTVPEADRPGHAAVYYHQLGTDPKTDRLVHEKTGDPKVFIQGDISKDGRFLFVSKYYGWAKVDVVYKDLRRDKEWKPLAVGMDAKFYPDAHKGRIYVLTNHEAPRFRLMEFDPSQPNVADWKEVVPQHATAVLKGMHVVGGQLALNYLEKASSRIIIVDPNGKQVRTIALPGIGTVAGPSGHPDDDVIYYGFSSYTTPDTIYETSVTKGGDRPYFELEVPVDPEPYTVEQVFYPSKDGTKVSMFIVRRKDMKKDGSTPLLLHGYGGFNISELPHFNAANFAWLEAGGAIALPNLRGGGEYGEAWHRAGMLGNKQNVFDDFIGAAEWLIAKGYTKSDKLAIRGGSNGGLLVGAVMVQRPELFRAVICAVPLLDMVRYHRFGSGKTWISEYGSADDPKQFAYLHAYSPYHHVKEGTAYPALLMLTSDSDDRVDPLHARKFVAAVRHASTSGHPVWLRVEENAGHGGGDMIKKRVEQRADQFAFLMHELGMKP